MRWRQSKESQNVQDYRGRSTGGGGRGGLKIGGITILNPDCVAKTYPGYWDAFRALGIALKD